MAIGVGSEEEGREPCPTGFSYMYRIVDRRLNIAIFGLFLLFFGLFSVAPRWKFFCRRPWLGLGLAEIHF